MQDSPRPFFSVIIPCYNRASSILPTFESVVAQTFKDFECIVVDDGSDDSEELLATLLSLDDKRFVYIKQENQGGGAARNTGILAARGEYTAFLDSDDLFLPYKLERVRKFIDQTRADAMYSRAYVDRGIAGRLWVRPDRGILEEEDVGEYLFVANQFIPTPTIVMRSSSASKVLFDPMLRKGQDLDFCLRAHAYGLRFRMIDEPLIIWIDRSEAGRASRHAGVRAPSEWLRRSSGLLSRKAVLGYRATVLAYYQPKAKVAVVLWDFVAAYVVAGVPLRIIVRQLLRYALPRSAYRRVANLAVRLRGKTDRM